MQTRRLGRNGPEVSAIGLGCGGFTQGGDDAESVATIEAALDAGITFLNTADFYGAGYSEQLIGRALRTRRDRAVLSVKCGALFSPSRAFLGLDGRPASVKNFAAYSLQRLGVEAIDLFQVGRADPAVPYEDTVGAIADLIKEGKVRHLGVSEVGADLLRRAHAVHPVAALEIEYSLACRFIEAAILPTARELGVGIVAYRVLADGLLSGATAGRTLGGGAHFLPPRLEGDNLAHNLATVAALNELAAARGATPAAVAVAWLLTRGDDVVPLVGMRRPGRVAENVAVTDLRLTVEELAALDRAFAPGAIVGDRYPPFVLKFAAR